MHRDSQESDSSASRQLFKSYQHQAEGQSVMNWIRANPSRRRERLENAHTCPAGALSDQDPSDSFLVSAWSKPMITLTSLKKLKHLSANYYSYKLHIINHIKAVCFYLKDPVLPLVATRLTAVPKPHKSHRGFLQTYKSTTQSAHDRIWDSW